MSCRWQHGTSRSGKPPFFVYVKLGDNVTTTHGKIQQAFGDDAMSRAQAVPGTQHFLKAERLLKISSSAGDHQQHGQVKIQHG